MRKAHVQEALDRLKPACESLHCPLLLHPELPEPVVGRWDTQADSHVEVVPAHSVRFTVCLRSADSAVGRQEPLGENGTCSQLQYDVTVRADLDHDSTCGQHAEEGPGRLGIGDGRPLLACLQVHTLGEQRDGAHPDVALLGQDAHGAEGDSALNLFTPPCDQLLEGICDALGLCGCSCKRLLHSKVRQQEEPNLLSANLDRGHGTLEEAQAVRLPEDGALAHHPDLVAHARLHLGRPLDEDHHTLELLTAFHDQGVGLVGLLLEEHGQAVEEGWRTAPKQRSLCQGWDRCRLDPLPPLQLGAAILQLRPLPDRGQLVLVQREREGRGLDNGAAEAEAADQPLLPGASTGRPSL
mmetsp:Transcript_33397/g.80091  ORF Transcript_33397/g.80091 Transcript_33397/m.80091 type:complete len:354 (+) Transcript_33397:430-1491(+)